MDGLFGRALSALVALTLGAIAGWWLGMLIGWAMAGLFAGALLGAGVHHLRDAVSAGLLLRWLRDPTARSAPRGPTLWAEISYRIERHLLAQRRQTDAQALRLQQFLKAIEASPNGVVLLDGDDRIEWCNPAAAEHLGLHGDRDLMQPITNLVRLPSFVAHLQSGEWRDALLLTHPGNDTMLSILVRPYGEQHKLLLSQDVTERARADAMRRDFVANVSHEIRTPLTVLAGYVETLTVLKLDDAERTRVLTVMRQQTDRMTTLVADLLQLAQLEGSPRPPMDRVVDLGRLLARTVAEASTLSADRHVLRVMATEHHGIAGDEVELHSAIANLLQNAVRYTPDQGHIDLQVQTRPDGSGVIEVVDTGVGIAAEHLPRLAERFYRVDRGRSRETGGTGLGLAIVKHVILRHGGTLEVESDPGKGSTFRLVFPPTRWRTLPAEQPADQGAEARA
ncbi:MAG: phosphate regulon sensor histidine kinase PhoR [Aquabacterium sp.]